MNSGKPTYIRETFFDGNLPLDAESPPPLNGDVDPDVCRPDDRGLSEAQDHDEE